MVDRQIPHNVDAEEALIGALILDGLCIRNIQLSPDDFYSERNKNIFTACQNLYKSLKIIDQITISQELSRMGKLQEIGGVAYLTHCISVCPTSLEAPHYAGIIGDLSRSRDLIKLSEKIADIGYKIEDVSKLDDLVNNFKKSYTTETKITTPFMAANDIINLTTRYSEPSHAPKWGYLDLDNITAGIYPEYAIWGARTSIGKTQLFLDIIKNLSDQGVYVLLASSEMTNNQIYERKISSEIGKGVLELRKHGMSELEQDYTLRIAEGISSQTVHYLSGDLYFKDIYREAHRLRDKNMLDVLFVDYIGALRDCYTENKDSQSTRISRISNKFQALTHELGISVNVASQLNREIEHRPNDKNSKRKPQLSDLRDSGSLEQDADVVFLLHRDEKENGELSEYLNIKMAKNRQLGPAKPISLQFNQKLYRYVDCTKREGNE